MHDALITNNIIRNIKHLLDDIITSKYPIDKKLSYFFKNNKKLNQELRYIIVETVYNFLRYFFTLQKYAKDDNLFTMIGILWVYILKLDDHKYKFLYLKVIDFEYIKSIAENFHVDILELPEWSIDILKKQYSIDEIKKIDNSMRSEASINLRINTMKANIKEVAGILKQDNIIAEPTSYSAFGLTIQHKISLMGHKLFKNGVIEVQDQSSQIACMILAPRRGDMVVDFCAGAGGKALTLGMLMKNTGRIYAFDINQKRLDNLIPRLGRSGLSNIHPQVITSESDTKIKKLYNKIDKVFVDAPCSGFGTLRRSPELKLKHTLSSIKEFNQKQLSILTEASKLLKIGGRLVYATCSILTDENEEIVEQFLTNHPNFQLTTIDNTILNLPNFKQNKGYMTLLPHIHNTDGFFAALITRVA